MSLRAPTNAAPTGEGAKPASRCAHEQQTPGDRALDDLRPATGGWRGARTGRCEDRPGVAVRSYPVRLDGNAVLVGV